MVAIEANRNSSSFSYPYNYYSSDMTNTPIYLSSHYSINNNYYLDHQTLKANHNIIMTSNCGECQGYCFRDEFSKHKLGLKDEDRFVNQIHCYCRESHERYYHHHDPMIFRKQKNSFKKMMCNQIHPRGRNNACPTTLCHSRGHRDSATGFHYATCEVCPCPATSNNVAHIIFPCFGCMM